MGEVLDELRRKAIMEWNEQQDRQNPTEKEILLNQDISQYFARHSKFWIFMQDESGSTLERTCEMQKHREPSTGPSTSSQFQDIEKMKYSEKVQQKTEPTLSWPDK